VSRRPPKARTGSTARRGPAPRRPRGTGGRSARGAERFAARSRRRIIGRLLTGLAVALAAAAVGAAVWLVGWSDATALDEVRVSGTGAELGDRVREVADPPVGTPLIRVNTEAIETVVAELPEVADVTVSRSWPRAVTITVTPREAAAAVADGESWWSVDASGVLFDQSSTQPPELPVLDAPTDADALATRATGVAVLIGLPDDLHDLVTAVSAPSEAAVELTLTDGATVLWGTADEMARKAEVLLALLPEEARHYDVSAPTNPAVRY
jgi:cell division protein FtsQ